MRTYNSFFSVRGIGFGTNKESLDIISYSLGHRVRNGYDYESSDNPKNWFVVCDGRNSAKNFLEDRCIVGMKYIVAPIQASEDLTISYVKRDFSYFLSKFRRCEHKYKTVDEISISSLRNGSPQRLLSSILKKRGPLRFMKLKFSRSEKPFFCILPPTQKVLDYISEQFPIAEEIQRELDFENPERESLEIICEL